MSISQMRFVKQLNEEMVARMEELLLENMRLTVRAEDAEDEVAKLEAYMTSPKQQDQIDKLTVRAEEAEAELAEMEEEKDSWEDRADKREEEIDQLSSLLERAQRSHIDQRKEIKELKAEVVLLVNNLLKADQVAASL